jgi:hypothetical protein
MSISQEWGVILDGIWIDNYMRRQLEPYETLEVQRKNVREDNILIGAQSSNSRRAKTKSKPEDRIGLCFSIRDYGTTFSLGNTRAGDMSLNSQLSGREAMWRKPPLALWKKAVLLTAKHSALIQNRVQTHCFSG